MEKYFLRKLFLVAATGFVLVGCGNEEATDTEEDTSVETPSDNDSDTASDAETVNATIHIVIDGETIADLSKEVIAEEGMYLLDVMHENYDIGEEGTFIYSIEGYEQDLDAERYWLSYSEGEMLMVGAADYELEDGEEIEWRLEDSE